jgi:AAA domain-containing protein
MEIQFKKASKQQAWLRMGISGPAGAGKTYTALKVASGLGGKILVIDTQRGQANHYGNQFEFDIYVLTDHHPDSFIKVINAAIDAGYRHIIIDSVTHEWTGKNGCLELHDQEVDRQKVKNSFTAWNAVTPLHNKFFDTLNCVPAHIIGTIRSKMDYIQDKDDTGRTTVRKVGMGSIQREGSDYEFDILMEIDLAHTGVIQKCRDGENPAYKLDGRVFKKPGAEFVQALKLWLSDGTPAPQVSSEQIAIDGELKSLFLQLGKTETEWPSVYSERIKPLDFSGRAELADKWRHEIARRKVLALREQLLDYLGPEEFNVEVAKLCDGVFDISQLGENTLCSLASELAKTLKKLQAEKPSAPYHMTDRVASGS